MNEYTPPPLPSMLNPTPPAVAAPVERPLGENPDDHLPIPGVLAAVESMLRQPRRVMYHLRQPGSGHLIIALLMVAGVQPRLWRGRRHLSGDMQLWAPRQNRRRAHRLGAHLPAEPLIFSC